MEPKVKTARLVDRYPLTVRYGIIWTLGWSIAGVLRLGGVL